MGYFTAVLARGQYGWQAAEVDVDQVDDLDGLSELLRKQAEDDGPVLCLIEQEDVWFGLVRIDGEDDPHVFVSDVQAARRSAFGDMLLDDDSPIDLDLALGLEPDPTDVDLSAGSGGVGLVGADGALADEEDEDEDDEEDAPATTATVAGDVELLSDLGVPGDELIGIAEEHGDATGEALSALAERVGALDVLDELR